MCHLIAIDCGSAKFSGRQRHRNDSSDKLLTDTTIANQIFDGDHRDGKLPRKLFKLGKVGHAVAVLTADLDQGAGGASASQTKQIDCRLGVSGPSEHSAVHSKERIHVARLQKVLGNTGGAGERSNGAGAVFCADAGSGSDVINGTEKCGFVGSRVAGFFDHGTQAKPSGIFGGDRHAQRSATNPQHKVDLFGSD